MQHTEIWAHQQSHKWACACADLLKLDLPHLVSMREVVAHSAIVELAGTAKQGTSSALSTTYSQNKLVDHAIVASLHLGRLNPELAHVAIIKLFLQRVLIVRTSSITDPLSVQVLLVDGTSSEDTLPLQVFICAPVIHIALFVLKFLLHVCLEAAQLPLLQHPQTRLTGGPWDPVMFLVWSTALSAGHSCRDCIKQICIFPCIVLTHCIRDF